MTSQIGQKCAVDLTDCRDNLLPRAHILEKKNKEKNSGKNDEEDYYEKIKPKYLWQKKVINYYVHEGKLQDCFNAVYSIFISIHNSVNDETTRSDTM